MTCSITGTRGRGPSQKVSDVQGSRSTRSFKRASTQFTKSEHMIAQAAMHSDVPPLRHLPTLVLGTYSIRRNRTFVELLGHPNIVSGHFSPTNFEQSLPSVNLSLPNFNMSKSISRGD
jgi:hypothetical protein